MISTSSSIHSTPKSPIGNYFSNRHRCGYNQPCYNSPQLIMEQHDTLSRFLKPQIIMKTRPNRITVLALCFIGVAIWNGLRFLEAIINWQILREYQSDPGPLYLAISGGFWFLVGASIFWGLWRGKAWAWYATIAGSAGYGAWYWLDRLVLQKPHSNWPFALSITIVFLLLVLLIMLSSRTRKYFSKR